MAKTKTNRASNKKLTHVDPRGRASMVDVSAKTPTTREARAEAVLKMKPGTLKLIKTGKAAKGDVLAVSRVAGIQAAKKTSDLIPLCHAIALSKVAVEFESRASGHLNITTMARCVATTGVEMEALAAASVAALTVYDMLKAVDRGMVIERVRLLEKSGGRSGHWKV